MKFASQGAGARARPTRSKGAALLGGAGAKTNHLDAKTRELIALAVAVTTRCDGCIAFHSAEAVKLGVTDDEIAEALGVAINLNAGAAMVYSSHVLDAVDQPQGISQERNSRHVDMERRHSSPAELRASASRPPSSCATTALTWPSSAAASNAFATRRETIGRDVLTIKADVLSRDDLAEDGSGRSRTPSAPSISSSPTPA